MEDEELEQIFDENSCQIGESLLNWNLQVNLEWHSKSFPIVYKSWEGFGKNPAMSRCRITPGPTKQKTFWKPSQT